jgi:hypothetical protein
LPRSRNVAHPAVVSEQTFEPIRRSKRRRGRRAARQQRRRELRSAKAARDAMETALLARGGGVVTLAGIRVDDVVLCEVRGARFYALVRDHDDRGLTVAPIERSQLPRGLFINRVTARQVVAHWRKSRAKTAAQRRAEQCDREQAGATA